mmetsp:Transcript_4506/g.17043  ORF Transcript_4506/g.17043 Transcript_4506/m.17043 type:complete len:93 (-) Transcript_4506:233-511(-)
MFKPISHRKAYTNTLSHPLILYHFQPDQYLPLNTFSLSCDCNATVLPDSNVTFVDIACLSERLGNEGEASKEDRCIVGRFIYCISSLEKIWS